MWECIVGIKKSGWIINFYSLLPRKKFLVVFLFKSTQFSKFISSIKFYFFGSPRNERSTYIKDLNCSWSMKSSHSRADLFTFILICSKQISSLVFVISVGAPCCFDKYVHLFTSLFINSTQTLLLHLRITISSSSPLLYFISSFTISTWIFMLHLGTLILYSSLVFPFTSLFVFSTSLFLLSSGISISSYSLLIASLHCGISALKFEL